MKDRIKIIDSTFSHSKLGYCSDFQSSELFTWERYHNNINDNEFVVYTDLRLFEPKRGVSVAWLIEPLCFAPANYQYIKDHIQDFDYILTHEKSLLSLDERISFVPFGCCWVSPNDQKIYDKTKNVSIISSNKKITDGHKLRHEVIREFGEYIDVYGRGYNPIDLKIDGLKDYRYSIVIENCKRDYWFTEKLIDCFMTGTIPVYWGCPSIGDFFDTEGMIMFDNSQELKTILETCDEDLYVSKFESIKTNFELTKKFLLPDDHVYKFIKNMQK